MPNIATKRTEEMGYIFNTYYVIIYNNDSTEAFLYAMEGNNIIKSSK